MQQIDLVDYDLNATENENKRDCDDQQEQQEESIVEEHGAAEAKRLYVFAVIVLFIAVGSYSFMGPTFVLLNKKGVKSLLAAVWRNVYILFFLLPPTLVELYRNVSRAQFHSWFTTRCDVITKQTTALEQSLQEVESSQVDLSISNSTTRTDIEMYSSVSQHAPPINPSETYVSSQSFSSTISDKPTSSADDLLEDCGVQIRQDARTQLQMQMNRQNDLYLSVSQDNNPMDDTNSVLFDDDISITENSKEDVELDEKTWYYHLDRPILVTVLASFFNSLSLSLWVCALRYTNTVSAALLATISPILFVIFYKCKGIAISNMEIIAVIIAFCGVLVCMLSSIISGDPRDNADNDMAVEGRFAEIFGDILCVLSASCSCVQIVVASRARKIMPVFTYTFFNVGFVLLFCVCFTFVVENTRIFCTQNDCIFGFAQHDVAPSLLLLGLLGGWIAMVGFNFSLKYVSNMFYSVAQFLEPVLTGVISYFLGFETAPKWPLYVGGAIVASGTVLLTKAEENRKMVEAEKLAKEEQSRAEAEAFARIGVCIQSHVEWDGKDNEGENASDTMTKDNKQHFPILDNVKKKLGNAASLARTKAAPIGKTFKKIGIMIEARGLAKESDVELNEKIQGSKREDEEMLEPARGYLSSPKAVFQRELDENSENDMYVRKIREREYDCSKQKQIESTVGQVIQLSELNRHD